MSPPSPQIRAYTRRTLPSTAGTACPKALAQGRVGELPVKAPKKARRVEKRAVWLIFWENRVALRRRHTQPGGRTPDAARTSRMAMRHSIWVKMCLA